VSVPVSDLFAINPSRRQRHHYVASICFVAPREERRASVASFCPAAAPSLIRRVALRGCSVCEQQRRPGDHVAEDDVQLAGASAGLSGDELGSPGGRSCPPYRCSFAGHLPPSGVVDDVKSPRAPGRHGPGRGGSARGSRRASILSSSSVLPQRSELLSCWFSARAGSLKPAQTILLAGSDKFSRRPPMASMAGVEPFPSHLYSACSGRPLVAPSKETHITTPKACGVEARRDCGAASLAQRRRPLQATTLQFFDSRSCGNCTAGSLERSSSRCRHRRGGRLVVGRRSIRQHAVILHSSLRTRKDPAADRCGGLAAPSAPPSSLGR